MTTEQIIQEIESHYQRIQQVEAEGRYYYEHYLDWALAEHRPQFDGSLQVMQEAYGWAVLPWDDQRWQAYQPQVAATIPSALRIGRLKLAGAMNWGEVPALVRPCPERKKLGKYKIARLPAH